MLKMITTLFSGRVAPSEQALMEDEIELKLRAAHKITEFIRGDVKKLADDHTMTCAIGLVLDDILGENIKVHNRVYEYPCKNGMKTKRYIVVEINDN